MNKIKELMYELVEEIIQLDVEDIEVFQKEWMEQLKVAGIGEGLIALCNDVCSVIIEEKKRHD